MSLNQVGKVKDPRELVEEYKNKLDKLDHHISEYDSVVNNIYADTSIGGSFGGEEIFCCSRPSLSKTRMEKNLLKSAWWACYKSCNMDILATASDKKMFKDSLQNPPPFTVENLTSTFGPYLVNQRDNILRGLAEAFITLDDAYKSHSKVKVGVKGLPKRVIIKNAHSEWGRAWGWNKVEDMLNALKVFDGEGLVDRDIISDIRYKKLKKYRGMEFKWFKNGNLHIHFDKHSCLQINRGLAEYYGDVLPDVEPDKTDLKPDLNKTTVSKDLQYYPTPPEVADVILRDITFYDGDRVLEPSCGCGRILDAITRVCDDENRRGYKQNRPDIEITGVEYNKSLVDKSRAKGYKVVHTNFLEFDLGEKFNKIIMNPPFYGKHYLKHIEHAISLMDEKDSVLVSILPATSHYDHKILPSGYRWRDLPVGSFSSSGTRVPTGYAVWRF